jgi:Zn-dependent alcohol dehydrogenase
MVTRAAVLRAFGAPQAVEEVQLRTPGAGEALVRLTAAGVWHSDVGQADGEWDYPLPAVLGHESARVVEEVGAGVAVEPGTRVLLSSAPGCGRCADGRGPADHRQLAHHPGREPISAYSLLACFSHHAVVVERSLIAGMRLARTLLPSRPLSSSSAAVKRPIPDAWQLAQRRPRPRR